MSTQISITLSKEAHNRLKAVQKRLTENRKANNPEASKANQVDALEWILKHTLMPISDFQDDPEEVE